MASSGYQLFQNVVLPVELPCDEPIPSTQPLAAKWALDRDELAVLTKALDKDHDDKFSLEEFKDVAAALSAKLGAAKLSDDVVNQIFEVENLESGKNKGSSLNKAELEEASAKLEKKLQELTKDELAVTTKPLDKDWVLILRQTLPHLFLKSDFTSTESQSSALEIATDPRIEELEGPNYAIVKQMEDFRSHDGLFKFMLRWPDSVFKDQIWKQSSNPATSRTVEGYEAISAPYDSGLRPCHGLRHNGSHALMHGSTDERHWYCAVGAYHTYKGFIPGPNASAVKKVELWAAKSLPQSLLPEPLDHGSAVSPDQGSAAPEPCGKEEEIVKPEGLPKAKGPAPCSGDLNALTLPTEEECETFDHLIGLRQPEGLQIPLPAGAAECGGCLEVTSLDACKLACRDEATCRSFSFGEADGCNKCCLKKQSVTPLDKAARTAMTTWYCTTEESKKIDKTKIVAGKSQNDDGSWSLAARVIIDLGEPKEITDFVLISSRTGLNKHRPKKWTVRGTNDLTAPYEAWDILNVRNSSLDAFPYRGGGKWKPHREFVTCPED